MRNKKIFKIILSSMLLGSVITSFMVNPIIAFAETPLDRIEKTKILEVDFNNNKAINIVNNKEYQASNSNVNYVSSVKGNGYEPNNSKITIPFSDLNIANTDTVLTVSFLFKYDKADTGVMPISFVTQNNNIYDLWITDGFFGFNTGNRDLYGIVNPFSDSNKFYNVIAEFNFTDITKSKIYIDGVAQRLSYKRQETSYLAPIDKATGSLSIGGLKREDMYNIKNKSMIDEVKIFKKSLIADEVTAIAKSQQIPELRTEVVSNKNVSVNWATEILQENLLWNAGFEEGENRPSLSYSKSPVTGSTLGEQSFSSNAKYSGYLGYQLLDTYNGKGNHFAFPLTQSNTSKTTWSSLKNVIDRGMDLSISVRAKSTGTSNFSIIGQGGFETKLYNWTSKLVKDVSKGDVWLYVDELDPYWKIQPDGKTPVSQYKVFPDEYDEYIKQDNHIREIDVENKAIRLANGVYRDMKAGETLKRRNWFHPFSSGNASIGNTNMWTLYNFNTKVSNNPYYDPMSRGFSLIMLNSTNSSLYLDDLKLGYATKVRLYRDNNKIYDGYASSYNDTSATDKKAPTIVTGIKYNMNLDSSYNRNLNITFNASEDIGTTYNYNITSVDKNNVESPLSKTQTQVVKSGLKGYSYVIDKSSSTVPDNTVDTTSTTINKAITDSGVYYLHIKAIDNAGNVSSVTHQKIDIPVLSVQSKPSDNMIRLDWTLSDINDKTFKVYQKKEDSNEFQSIGATNFDKNKEVKVLNIYPPHSTLETYTTWKGETVTLPISASLKKWMEEPNSENPKGYGKGLISVDSVLIDNYNANPESYLKNSDGTYKYDVIMFGTLDGNGGKDLSTLSLEATKSFIDTGRGVLFGHDTVSQWQNRSNFPKLEEYIKVKTYGFKGTVTSTNITKMWNMPWSGGTEVSITKKGSLINYPWEIGDIGTVLNIPYTHTNSQIAKGDVWLKFTNPHSDSESKVVIDTKEYSDNGEGTNMAYLTSYNNTAMIQTGHAINRYTITTDEQKILANTLFYLNQLSNDTFLNDKSGQDVKAPTMPTLNNYTFTENGEITVTFNPSTDIGSKYKYYMEYEDKSGNNMAISEIKEVEILSGLKGYSYVVDSNPTTIPDNIIEFSSISPVKIKTATSKEIYVHIKAIDNAGNSSETLHYRLTDMTKPTLQLSLAPNSWTNGNVTINAKATDSESGIKSIILPNGNVVSKTTTSYTVSSNGIYCFKAIDYMGNETTSSIIVSNIDKKNPTVTIQNNTNWTNQNVQVIITGTD